jgi:predicted nucleotidyltransferase
MPNTSSDSVKKKSVPKDNVITELKRWARKITIKKPEIKKMGYFGSYARGDYTPASDLDILVIINKSDKVFFKRADDYVVDDISVGCELFVFSECEINERVKQYKHGWIDTILKEVIWVYPGGD